MIAMHSSVLLSSSGCCPLLPGWKSADKAGDVVKQQPKMDRKFRTLERAPVKSAKQLINTFPFEHRWCFSYVAFGNRKAQSFPIAVAQLRPNVPVDCTRSSLSSNDLQLKSVHFVRLLSIRRCRYCTCSGTGLLSDNDKWQNDTAAMASECWTFH